MEKHNVAIAILTGLGIIAGAAGGVNLYLLNDLRENNKAIWDHQVQQIDLIRGRLRHLEQGQAHQDAGLSKADDRLDRTNDRIDNLVDEVLAIRDRELEQARRECPP